MVTARLATEQMVKVMVRLATEQMIKVMVTAMAALMTIHYSMTRSRIFMG